MARLYEGASGLSVVFYLIIIVGGFLFGTKTHHDKQKERRKAEKKYEKEMKKSQLHHDSELEKYQEFLRWQEEELIEHRKLEDPFWHYYDDVEGKMKTIPGDMNYPSPRPPQKRWDGKTQQEYYHFYPQEKE